MGHWSLLMFPHIESLEGKSVPAGNGLRYLLRQSSFKKKKKMLISLLFFSELH